MLQKSKQTQTQNPMTFPANISSPMCTDLLRATFSMITMKFSFILRRGGLQRNKFELGRNKVSF